jgi:hypothetical protein
MKQLDYLPRLILIGKFAQFYRNIVLSVMDWMTRREDCGLIFPSLPTREESPDFLL